MNLALLVTHGDQHRLYKKVVEEDATKFQIIIALIKEAHFDSMEDMHDVEIIVIPDTGRWSIDEDDPNFNEIMSKKYPPTIIHHWSASNDDFDDFLYGKK